jgi:hypothetical protein
VRGPIIFGQTQEIKNFCAAVSGISQLRIP